LLPLVRAAKQAHQVLHPAKVGPLIVNAATTPTGVEVDAPAISTHHGQVKLALVGIEGFDRFAPFTWI
jgi:hypothetical protein